MVVRGELEGVALRLAERIIQLLDRGSFTATYKYAVLVGLMDLSMELTSATGSAPEMITTRQLAEKVIELYWPHCAPFDERGVLQQNWQGAQAEIVVSILRFRQRLRDDPTAVTSLAAARASAPEGAWERLVRSVEWKLVEMPLPKLQVIGGEEDRFLYEYGFPRDMKNRKPLQRYWESEQGAFDNRLLLKPGVSAALVALNGLLRPLIHRQWAMMVAHINRLEEWRLEWFLFSAERESLDEVRPHLCDLQRGLCFYCDKPLPTACHVDHFIPWSRHADNGIHNLVIADERCNGKKRDHLAAAEHVERWRERSVRNAVDLATIVEATRWESRLERTLGVARAIYRMLPDDTRLWQRDNEFLVIERSRIAAALAA